MSDIELMQHIDNLELTRAAVIFRYGEDIAEQYEQWVYIDGREWPNT